MEEFLNLKEIKNSLRTVNREFNKELLNSTKEATPVYSGLLRDSWEYNENLIGDEMISNFINEANSKNRTLGYSDDEFYAEKVEYGLGYYPWSNRTTRPRGMFKNALENTVLNLNDMLKKEFAKFD